MASATRAAGQHSPDRQTIASNGTAAAARGRRKSPTRRAKRRTSGPLEPEVDEGHMVEISQEEDPHDDRVVAGPPRGSGPPLDVEPVEFRCLERLDREHESAEGEQ